MKSLEFLIGGGEMGKIIRSYDWSSTSIGPIDSWPQSLLTTLSIILNTNFPMFLFWGEDHICFYNDAYRPSLGNSGKHPSAIGKSGKEVWPEIWDNIKPLIDEVMTGGKASWSEDQLLPIYRNGKLEDVYWTFSYSPVKIESGKIGGVFVTCTETTEKVRSFQKLEESENLLRFAIEATELGTWDYNPKTNKFTGNTRLKEWFGVSSLSEIELPLAINVIAESDRFKVVNAIEKALDYKSGGNYDIEYTIVHPETQSRKVVRAKGKAWFDDQNEAYRFNGTLQDITEQFIIRKELENSKNRLNLLIEESPVRIVFLTGRDMRIELANEVVLKSWNRDKSIIGQPLKEILSEPEIEPFLELLDKVYTTGEPVAMKGAPVKNSFSGELVQHYYDFWYIPMRNEDGEVFGVLSTAVDVTEQVLNRKEIEEAREKARLAIESADLGPYEVDLLTGEIITSDRFNAIWGVEGKMTREKLISFIHPDDLKLRDKAHAESLKTGNLNYETRIIQVDHSVQWVKIKGKILYDDSHKPITLLGVIQDITEQKRFAEELTRQVNDRTLQLQRSNDDLLQFAHVASHDLKEPIRKIKIFTNMIENEFAQTIPERGMSYLGKIQNATDRMFSMVEGVLAYSTINSAERPIEKVDLYTTLEHIETDLEVIMSQKEAILKRERLPKIEGAAVLLYQLFYNLINNALKFAKADEKPVITISSEIFEKETVGFLRIWVADNGIGLDPDYSDKIFDAFTRLNTKDKYEGTGLGLALCKKIVERHHGSITAGGEIGKGAVFIIELPLKQTQEII